MEHLKLYMLDEVNQTNDYKNALIAVIFKNLVNHIMLDLFEYSLFV